MNEENITQSLIKDLEQIQARLAVIPGNEELLERCREILEMLPNEAKDFMHRCIDIKAELSYLNLSFAQTALLQHLVFILENNGYTSTEIVRMLKEIYLSMDEDGKPTKDSTYKEIIQKAKQRQLMINDPSRVMSLAAPDLIYFPLDKVNKNLFTASWDYSGTSDFKNFRTTPRKQDKQAGVRAEVRFALTDDSKARPLNSFDGRVLRAVWSCYVETGPYMTFTQIHHAMGNTGRPASKQIASIKDSLEKMAETEVRLDNASEIALGMGYKSFYMPKADKILHYRLEDAVVNGKFVDEVVHILIVPFLYEFADSRNQIARVARNLLETPLNTTSSNILLEDYLLDHIMHLKAGRRHGALYFATFYPECGVKMGVKREKERATEKVTKILQSFKDKKFIKDFVVDADFGKLEIKIDSK